MTTSPIYQAEFRFYAELNDFLPALSRYRTQNYYFNGHPGIKDPIEVFGIPHTEVALMIVNGLPVKFNYQLQTNDRVAVYPLFNHIDIAELGKLREPLPAPRFIMDVNLGKLAKRMRLLGFDCLYRNDYDDMELVNIAVNEQRIALTRDRRLLFAKQLEHGYWVRNIEINQQITELLTRFNLKSLIQPFKRCLRCNGLLISVDKADILPYLEPKTRLYYETFYRCHQCQHIYWHGSHIDNMQQQLADFLP